MHINIHINYILYIINIIHNVIWYGHTSYIIYHTYAYIHTYIIYIIYYKCYMHMCIYYILYIIYWIYIQKHTYIIYIYIYVICYILYIFVLIYDTHIYAILLYINICIYHISYINHTHLFSFRSTQRTSNINTERDSYCYSRMGLLPRSPAGIRENSAILWTHQV